MVSNCFVYNCSVNMYHIIIIIILILLSSFSILVHSFYLKQKDLPCCFFPLSHIPVGIGIEQKTQ